MPAVALLALFVQLACGEPPPPPSLAMVGSVHTSPRRQLGPTETALLAQLRAEWARFHGADRLLALLAILEAQLLRDDAAVQALVEPLVPSLQQALRDHRPRYREFLPVVLDALTHPALDVRRAAFDALALPMPGLDDAQLALLMAATQEALRSPDAVLRSAAARRMWILARLGVGLSPVQAPLEAMAAEPTDAGFYAAFALAHAAHAAQTPLPAVALASHPGAPADLGEATAFASGYGTVWCAQDRILAPSRFEGPGSSPLPENARFYDPAQPGPHHRPCGVCGSALTVQIYGDGWADLTGKAWTEEYVCSTCGRHTLYAYSD